MGVPEDAEELLIAYLRRVVLDANRLGMPISGADSVVVWVLRRSPGVPDRGPDNTPHTVEGPLGPPESAHRESGDDTATVVWTAAGTISRATTPMTSCVLGLLFLHGLAGFPDGLSQGKLLIQRLPDLGHLTPPGRGPRERALDFLNHLEGGGQQGPEDEKNPTKRGKN